jgi:hypothetical protein
MAKKRTLSRLGEAWHISNINSAAFINKPAPRRESSKIGGDPKTLAAIGAMKTNITPKTAHDAAFAAKADFSMAFSPS